MSKRCFDLICSAVGLVFLIPIFSVFAIWIKLDSKGPVYFRQVRVGQFGRPFHIHKFRTMKLDSEKDGKLTVGSDARVTRAGKFLRKYKLDELPQLIDVFVGRMSLVGPRPEVQEFIDCYPVDIKNRVLSVRPGITDRASIEMVDENEILSSYSNPRQAYIDIILPIKQRYYLEYVDRQSLIEDAKIILATILKVIFR